MCSYKDTVDSLHLFMCVLNECGYDSSIPVATYILFYIHCYANVYKLHIDLCMQVMYSISITIIILIL